MGSSCCCRGGGGGGHFLNNLLCVLILLLNANSLVCFRFLFWWFMTETLVLGVWPTPSIPHLPDANNPFLPVKITTRLYFIHNLHQWRQTGHYENEAERAWGGGGEGGQLHHILWGNKSSHRQIWNDLAKTTRGKTSGITCQMGQNLLNKRTMRPNSFNNLTRVNKYQLWRITWNFSGLSLVCYRHAQNTKC